MLALGLLLCVGHVRIDAKTSPALLVKTHAQAPASAVAPSAVSRWVLETKAPFRAPLPLAPGWQRLAPARPLSDRELQDWARRLRADGRIAQVAIDAREQRQDVMPNDARFAQQWWLQALGTGNTGAAGLATAWSRSTGAPVSGEAPIVAVLDSGVTSHPELNSRVLPGYDFVSDANYSNDGDGRDNDASDPGDAITADDRLRQPLLFSGCPNSDRSSWHGTVIAGQVAAVSNNREGVAAASWNARFVPVRVAGKCGAAVSDIVAGLRWAAGLPVAGVPANRHPARLIVLSYGGIDPCDSRSATPEIAATAALYEATLVEVRAAGALVIVAAGNLRHEVGRPGSCAGAFAVASLNREGYKSNYSNFGRHIALSTPGGDMHAGKTCDDELADSGIVSTGNLGAQAVGAAGYVAASGTSFAAPAVAGAAALMLAVNPLLSVAQLEDGLRRSARPHVQVPLLGECTVGDNAGRCSCDTATCGAGLLDADEALAYALAPDRYVAPERAPAILTDARLESCAVKLGRPVPVPAPTPEPTPAPEPPPPTPGSVPPAPEDAPAAVAQGGGAASVAWTLGLALAVLSLWCTRAHPRSRRAAWSAESR